MSFDLAGDAVRTRFSVTLDAFGWWNCTVCWRPTSKLCQSMAARCVPWSIVVVDPV